MVIKSLKDVVSTIIEPAAAAIEFESLTSGKTFAACEDHFISMLREELRAANQKFQDNYSNSEA